MARTGSTVSRLGVGLAVGAVIALIALDLELASLVSFWGDHSVAAVVVVAASALLWLTPLRRVVAVAAALAAALWLVVTFTPLSRTLAAGLVRRDPPASAEAVYVFASRIQADGEPTAAAMSRLLKGLELIAEGRAGTLVVSELYRSRQYAPIARGWARELAPKAEVVAIGPVHDTHDEALAVGRLFQHHGWKRVLAVTSPLHTTRAALALESQGLEVVSVPSVETRYDLETLDRPGDRRDAFGPALHERIGLFVYRRRGWIGPTVR